MIHSCSSIFQMDLTHITDKREEEESNKNVDTSKIMTDEIYIFLSPALSWLQDEDMKEMTSFSSPRQREQQKDGFSKDGPSRVTFMMCDMKGHFDRSART